MQSGENFPIIEAVADKLGAAVGDLGQQSTQAMFQTTIKLGKLVR